MTLFLLWYCLRSSDKPGIDLALNPSEGVKSHATLCDTDPRFNLDLDISENMVISSLVECDIQPEVIKI